MNTVAETREALLSLKTTTLSTQANNAESFANGIVNNVIEAALAQLEGKADQEPVGEIKVPVDMTISTGLKQITVCKKINIPLIGEKEICWTRYVIE
ncbi:MAG TPA: hypothetical protein VFV43_00145 [Limnobacter sp.]|nr:hypothetical protein [Limnobacter sp.]